MAGAIAQALQGFSLPRLLQYVRSQVERAQLARGGGAQLAPAAAGGGGAADPLAPTKGGGPPPGGN